MSKDGAEIDSGFEGRGRRWQRGSEVSGWGGGDVRAVGVGTGIHGRRERSELGGILRSVSLFYGWMLLGSFPALEKLFGWKTNRK